MQEPTIVDNKVKEITLVWKKIEFPKKYYIRIWEQQD